MKRRESTEKRDKQAESCVLARPLPGASGRRPGALLEGQDALNEPKLFLCVLSFSPLCSLW